MTLRYLSCLYFHSSIKVNQQQIRKIYINFFLTHIFDVVYIRHFLIWFEKKVTKVKKKYIRICYKSYGGIIDNSLSKRNTYRCRMQQHKWRKKKNQKHDLNITMQTTYLFERLFSFACLLDVCVRECVCDMSTKCRTMHLLEFRINAMPTK